MIEDIRNHDPNPTPEERECMDGSIAAAGRVILFVAIALVMGVGGSQLLNPDHPTTVAASQR